MEGTRNNGLYRQYRYHSKITVLTWLLTLISQKKFLICNTRLSMLFGVLLFSFSCTSSMYELRHLNGDYLVH
jgi:hypothetical protein